jgi:hypothetical protein
VQTRMGSNFNCWRFRSRPCFKQFPRSECPARVGLAIYAEGITASSRRDGAPLTNSIYQLRCVAGSGGNCLERF